MTINFFMDFTYYGCNNKEIDYALAMTFFGSAENSEVSGNAHEYKYRKAYSKLYALAKKYPEYIRITTSVHPYNVQIFYKRVVAFECPVEILKEVLQILNIEF